MKIITLKVPAAVDTGNPPRGYAELRHPIEGSLTVADEEADRLFKAGQLAGEPEDVPTEDGTGFDDEGGDDEVEDDLEDQTVPELHILVTKEGVPLNDATRKADIIAAIRKHRAEQAA